MTETLPPEDGYELWLRYVPVNDEARLAEYRSAITQLVLNATSPTLLAAQEELTRALQSLLGTPIPLAEQVTQSGALVVGTPSPIIATLNLHEALGKLGDEGYLIVRTPVENRDCIIITANTGRRTLTSASFTAFLHAVHPGRAGRRPGRDARRRCRGPARSRRRRPR